MMTKNPEIQTLARSHPGWLAAIGIAYAAVFWKVLVDWAGYCWSTDDFSHCLLIPGVVAYLVYRDRARVGRLAVSSSTPGVAIVVLSLCCYFVGLGYSLNLFMRVGAVGTFLGIAAILFGWRLLRQQAFPVFFFLFAIPVPFVVYSSIALEMRGLVTDLSASVLQLFGVTAVNDGNVLQVADIRLGVVDACSGIRSLTAIVTLAVLVSYIVRSGIIPAVLIVLFALPAAILGNTIRVIVIATSLHFFGLDLTEGFGHSVLGLVVFAFSLGSIAGVWLCIQWVTHGSTSHRPTPPCQTSQYPEVANP